MVQGMIVSKRALLPALVLLALVACDEGTTPDAGPAPELPTGAQALEAPADAGPEAAPTDGGLRLPTSLAPGRYVGFSGDGALFAYAERSEDAGYPILTVVDSDTGRRAVDFPLDGPDADAKARAYLKDHGFAVGSEVLENPLGPDERLEVRVEGPRIDVLLWRGERPVRLEPPEAFRSATAHLGQPTAQIWGFSPKGTYAAIRIEEARPGHGAAVTYWVVNVAQGRAALRDGG